MFSGPFWFEIPQSHGVPEKKQGWVAGLLWFSSTALGTLEDNKSSRIDLCHSQTTKSKNPELRLKKYHPGYGFQVRAECWEAMKTTPGLKTHGSSHRRHQVCNWRICQRANRGCSNRGGHMSQTPDLTITHCEHLYMLKYKIFSTSIVYIC